MTSPSRVSAGFSEGGSSLACLSCSTCPSVGYAGLPIFSYALLKSLPAQSTRVTLTDACFLIPCTFSPSVMLSPVI